MDFRPPQSFDEYEVIRPLGRGGMGQVYLARDGARDCLVAIKFVAAGRSDATARGRLLAEARATARVQHPNVVGFHRVGELGPMPYIVSEYVPGRSLEDITRPIPWPRAVELGIGIARGLAAAHQQGVLHRDIKPANVVLSDEGTIKLVDFGLAKVRDTGVGSDTEVTLPGAGPRQRLTDPDAFLGTPLYTAPEVWRGDPASPRSDVYSVGGVLQALVTGRPPYDEKKNLVELYGALETGEPEPIGAEVDARFTALVRRCLAREPSDRYASADELLAALERLAAPGPLVDREPFDDLTTAAHVPPTRLQRSPIELRLETDTRPMLVLALPEVVEDLPPVAPPEDATTVVPVAPVRREVRMTTPAPVPPAVTTRRAATPAPFSGRARPVPPPPRVSEPVARGSRTPGVLAALAALGAVGLGVAFVVRSVTLSGREVPGPVGIVGVVEGRPASLSIGSEPVGATAKAARWTKHPAAPWALGAWSNLGRTPCTAERLEPGSWIVELTHADRATVQVPVLLGGGRDESVQVALPSAASIPSGLVAVPGNAVGEGFLVGRTETTFSEWIEFLDALDGPDRERRLPRADGLALRPEPAGGYSLERRRGAETMTARAGEPMSGQDWRRWPVTGIDWDDAQAYTSWLARSGKIPGARPCTEREWERAGHGADERDRPHGDQLAPGDANVDLGDQPAGPDEVGRHPRSASPFGVLDLVGNAWEWTRGEPSGVARGGGWASAPTQARLSSRWPIDPATRDATVGLRLCADWPR